MEYLHDFPADGGFQCAIVIWQIRQLDLLGLNGSTGITVGVRYGNRRGEAPGSDSLEASGRQAESARKHPWGPNQLSLVVMVDRRKTVFVMMYSELPTPRGMMKSVPIGPPTATDHQNQNHMLF